MTAQLAVSLQQAKDGGRLKAADIAAGLTAARERIFQQFDEGAQVAQLIQDMSAQIDQVLDVCFSQFIEGMR